MEKPTQNFVLNNSYKSKEIYPQKAKGMSFFAFVFSIFIYICIFYIFNLSPSDLFSNTKFWFFISNTLIIIILVDYGVFSSSSKEKYQHDIYQEYIMRRQRSAPTFNRNYYNITTKDPFYEKIKITPPRIKYPNNTLGIHVPETTQPTKPRPINGNSHRKKIEKHCTFKLDDKKFDGAMKNNEGHEMKKVMPQKLLRSKSEIAKKVTFDESKNVVRRVETERYDHLPDDSIDEDQENNEYAKMTDEELNRRVEDFIQRFNMQIRLQREIYN